MKNFKEFHIDRCDFWPAYKNAFVTEAFHGLADSIAAYVDEAVSEMRGPLTVKSTEPENIDTAPESEDPPTARQHETDTRLKFRLKAQFQTSLHLSPGDALCGEALDFIIKLEQALEVAKTNTYPLVRDRRIKEIMDG